LRVLQQARDEAHRFAITFQRKRRSLRTMTSELLRIPGVGEAKRRQLLEAFGSLQGVRDAAPEAIAALPGFGQKTAERVLETLRKNSPTAPATVGAELTPPDTSSDPS
jgi:excinuclease ABC subunit C